MPLPRFIIIGAEHIIGAEPVISQEQASPETLCYNTKRDGCSPTHFSGRKTTMNAEPFVARQELSTQEASEMAHLSRNQITHLLRQGKLEGKNFGKRLWVVYADSLERYLASPHKSGPRGPRKRPSTEQPISLLEKNPAANKEYEHG